MGIRPYIKRFYQRRTVEGNQVPLAFALSIFSI